MPRKRTRKTRPETLVRKVHVDSVGPSVFVIAEKRKGLPTRIEPSAYLVLRGKAEAVGGTSDHCVQVSADDRHQNEPSTSVGGIIQFKPVVSSVVWVPRPHFDWLWTIALAGELRYCRLAFTAPYRGHSSIVSASFDSEDEDA